MNDQPETPSRDITPYTARGLADFLAGLQHLSQETGVVVHAHGTQMSLEHRGRDLDVKLNRNFRENEYVIEVPWRQGDGRTHVASCGWSSAPPQMSGRVQPGVAQ